MADLEIEENYRDLIIAGVDEAGRGALSGPVVAAAVIIDQRNIIPGIRDSKKISKQNFENSFSEAVRLGASYIFDFHRF